MSNTRIGKVYQVGDAQQVTENFKKRELIIETDGKYPDFLKFEFAQEKCDLLHGLRKGQEVTVTFDIRGRKYTNKNGKEDAFISLRGWDLDKGTAKVAADHIAASPVLTKLHENQDDELPF